ncbi:hypothetical protein NDU88_002103 [Pleurodeles waltl]|uniref:Uncharacterized protein n=1 Tax=Pleurodeles waltl TaxID=8319 RepID=A0AAV7QBZ3_PLEWA|nr:hypothetical protein NDU88_002103 [Pleurodeles waltl]
MLFAAAAFPARSGPCQASVWVGLCPARASLVGLFAGSEHRSVGPRGRGVRWELPAPSSESNPLVRRDGGYLRAPLLVLVGWPHDLQSARDLAALAAPYRLAGLLAPPGLPEAVEHLPGPSVDVWSILDWAHGPRHGLRTLGDPWGALLWVTACDPAGRGPGPEEASRGSGWLALEPAVSALGQCCWGGALSLPRPFGGRPPGSLCPMRVLILAQVAGLDAGDGHNPVAYLLGLTAACDPLGAGPRGSQPHPAAIPVMMAYYQ